MAKEAVSHQASHTASSRLEAVQIPATTARYRHHQHRTAKERLQQHRPPPKNTEIPPIAPPLSAGEVHSASAMPSSMLSSFMTSSMFHVQHVNQERDLETQQGFLELYPSAAPLPDPTRIFMLQATVAEEQDHNDLAPMEPW